MSIIQYISPDKVQSRAIELFINTRKNLHLTMMMEEEWQSKTSEYRNLIISKIDTGINIKRIGFGPRFFFKKWKKYMQINNSHFEFRYIEDISMAQRMLISDKKEMLFAIYNNKNSYEKNVFYTSYSPLVQVFLDYFQSKWIYSNA